MKSRRLTIFCVALIALAGTPRAWHEISRILAFVQHKAQVKLWSKVLEPKNRDSSDLQLVVAAQPAGADRENLVSNCVFGREDSEPNHVSLGSPPGRRAGSRSFQRSVAPQKIAVAPASSASLVAKALKTPREVESLASLGHVRSLTESDPSLVAESQQLTLTLANAEALPQLPAIKSDAFKFVLIPMPNPIVSTLVEKETVVHLKLIKKALEENRLIRPKTCPKMRNAEFGLKI